MTGLEVGGWFASAFIEKLVHGLGIYLGGQYKYQNSNTVLYKLKSLERNMTQIQAAIHAASQRQIENPGLRTWLLNLKDACYDAESVLDMFEYQLIKGKIKGKNQRRSISATIHEVSGLPCGIVKHSLFCDGNIMELMKVADTFDELVSQMGSFLYLLNGKEGESLKKMEKRSSTSISSEPKLFGRDKERTHLIHLLQKQGAQNVDVLPIVGIGGVGKTSLVQSVYNDQSIIKNYFHVIAWVCVSDKFELRRLITEIIESASISRPADFHSLQSLDSVQRILKRGVQGVRFLIVLDDVWDEMPDQWEKLVSVLNCCLNGSKLIVTTRHQKLANLVKTKESITLGGLADEDYWNFFMQCAFGDENPEKHPDLKLFAGKIVENLGCLPLAAKAVGAVLKSNMSIQHWKKIAEGKLWQIEQLEDRVMSVFRLSYEHLPAQLKQCFVYCSLFPKDYHFSISNLVQLWIAQGFIQPNQYNTMEEIGEEYFAELLSRSFFQKTALYEDKYMIHDLLHELATNLSNGEILICDNNRKEFPARVRHICLGAKNLSLLCNDKNARKNLRSLVLFDCSDNSLNMLKRLKGLRVLILHKFRGKLSSKSIRSMIHLRYLAIEGYEDMHHKLPKSLGMLYHLQLIHLGFWRFSNPRCVLPKGIDKLINLQHLNANTRGIAGIGTLTLLRELCFHVNQRKRGFEIGQLRDVSQLRELVIKGLESVAQKEQASEAMLGNKKHLKALELCWESQTSPFKTEHFNRDDNEVLEGLQPHQNLGQLTIRGYNGNCPSWWNENWISHLSEIYLVNCSHWEIIPPLGQLPLLKVLRLERLHSLRRIGPEFYGINNTSHIAFPSLEKLVLDEMCELREWHKVEKYESLFPHLSHLQVYTCGNLRESLFLPSQLKLLAVRITAYGHAPFIDQNVESGGLLEVCCPCPSQLEEWIPSHNLASIETLAITITSQWFLDDLKEWFQHLTSLRSLRFDEDSRPLRKKLYSLGTACCSWDSEIANLPRQLIKNLSTLHKLSLSNCPQLKSLPQEGLPSSLQVLEIFACPLLEDRYRRNGSHWHEIAHIPTIKINNKVVER